MPRLQPLLEFNDLRVLRGFNGPQTIRQRVLANDVVVDGVDSRKLLPGLVSGLRLVVQVAAG